MKSRLMMLVGFLALVATAPSPVVAQRQPPTPDQRLDRLEREVQQVQRQLFPKGRPADTAGFADDPAATQSAVLTLNQRLDSLERQMQDLLRASEENGNRLRTVAVDMNRLSADQEQRIAALEQRIANTAVVPATSDAVPAASLPPAATRPKPQTPKLQPPRAAASQPLVAPEDSSPVGGGTVSDPAEDAYSEGFHQWEAGQFDQAITSLRAFTAAYPKHRRVSYANNLVGRALLDKGQARAAAEVLLANYRRDPQGDRAPDSLFYLGQALTKLGQAAQACKAYGELDAVYGAKIRPDLKKLESDARAQAQCS